MTFLSLWYRCDSCRRLVCHKLGSQLAFRKWKICVCAPIAETAFVNNRVLMWFLKLGPFCRKNPTFWHLECGPIAKHLHSYLSNLGPTDIHASLKFKLRWVSQNRETPFCENLAVLLTAGRNRSLKVFCVEWKGFVTVTKYKSACTYLKQTT